MIVILAVVILIILVFVMGAGLDITIPDFSWNKLAMMQEQTKQLEIQETNNTARWLAITDLLRYAVGGVVLFYLMRFGSKMVDYLQDKEIRNAQSYMLMPPANRMILDNYGEEMYGNLMKHVKQNKAEIILYDNQPAIKYKSNDITIIDL